MSGPQLAKSWTSCRSSKSLVRVDSGGNAHHHGVPNTDSQHTLDTRILGFNDHSSAGRCCATTRVKACQQNLSKLDLSLGISENEVSVFC